MEQEHTDISIEDLFKDEESIDVLPEIDEQNIEKDDGKDDMTETMRKRINKVKSSTKDAVAKELGYASYEEMSKANEKRLLSEAGLDEPEIEAVVEKLLQKRLSDDPRLKKLEEYEEQEKLRFVSSQLGEVNKLFGTSYKSVEQLPEDTLSLWEKTGNLKQAYLATNGESFIQKTKSVVENGDTNHLREVDNKMKGKTRSLTEAEKDIWRSIIPNITDEELSKKTINIKD